MKEALEAAPASERAALSERLSELLTDSAARPMEALTTTKKGKREVPQTLAQVPKRLCLLLGTRRYNRLAPWLHYPRKQLHDWMLFGYT